MSKRWIALLLCLLLLTPQLSLAFEGAYLSGEDLHALEPALEAFLEQLADTLIAHGLLDAAQREAWVLYQLGDYLQNGGYGSILILYTPDLLSVADASVSAKRFSRETEAGTVTLETLGRYAEDDSPLPGLPLDVELLDASGALLACRFRWIAEGGHFLIWDGKREDVVNVGATCINDGKPLYWVEEPMDGARETLILEILHPTNDELLASVTLTLVSGEDYWAPEALR